MISVPLEPTEAMLNAAVDAFPRSHPSVFPMIWKAMLAAAPSPAGGRDQTERWAKALYEANGFYTDATDWSEMASPDGGIHDLHMDMARAAQHVWDHANDASPPAGGREAEAAKAIWRIDSKNASERVASSMWENGEDLYRSLAEAALTAALSHPVSGGGELGALPAAARPSVSTEQAETPVVSGPTYEQVVAGVTRSVESVMTVIHGVAAADEEDIRSAIEAGAAIAFAGLIPAPDVAPSGGAS